MKDVLRKFHNLTLNCKTIEELYEYAFILKYDNQEHKELVNSLVDNAVLAAECSVLPIYYLEASKASGLKQDHNGRWY